MTSDGVHSSVNLSNRIWTRRRALPGRRSDASDSLAEMRMSQMRSAQIRLAARQVSALAMVGTVLLAGACGTKDSASPPAAGSAAAGLDTIDKGVVKVAIEPYMPYTDVKNGKLVGLDSEILQEAAANLGLKVEFNVTDFKGMLGGVQSHRVDVTIGGVGWSKDRAGNGPFPHPGYYSPPPQAAGRGPPLPTGAAPHSH